MHIVYLHQYFATPSMSGGTRSYEMARRLVAMGHKVTIITSWRVGTSDKREWRRELVDGIEVLWYPVPYSNAMTSAARIAAFFRFASAACRRAAAVNADLVYASSTPLTIAIPAIFASRSRQIPMVFEVRDLWPTVPIALGVLKNPVLKLLARWLERVAYSSSEAVVALSPAMADGVISTGYPAPRVAVIPNASDNQEFGSTYSARAKPVESATSPIERVIVYAGTLGRVNGVGYLADLALELSDIAPEVKVVVVGDGAELGVITQRAQQLGVLNKNFFLQSRIPKSEMPGILASATVAASTVIGIKELEANSANKVFDALAAGCPVLLNYGGWQADLVRRHNCGILTQGLPMREAAQLVATRLRDDEWVSSASGRARQLARTLFDRDELAHQLSELLVAAHAGDGERAASIAPAEPYRS